ncbi:MAG: NCS2 family permease [Clostridia bacterium]|nr:NCS2 family permease [Deltaproteobacteria bacterium]
MNQDPPLRTEILAGVTTFFTVAYIVVVNPTILAQAGMSFDGTLTATVVLTAAMTLFMGVYAKLPFAVAPGMGINAFFTFTLVLNQGIPWQTALGMVFWSGVLFVAISATPLREKVAKAIPQNLRIAAAVGIGLFLTFIGLKAAHIIAADPVTFVRVGHFSADTALAVFGLIMMLVLMQRSIPFAFLAGILLVTLAALVTKQVAVPATFLKLPDFTSVAGKLDIMGALKPALLPAIVSLFFTDLFDSISTFVGVSQATGLTDAHGEPKNLRQGLIVDAFATLTAGLIGTSAGTAYVESAAGIEVGGRTGRTSVVTALCFLPCLFIAPLAGVVPACATAPVLMLVGAAMFRSASRLSLEKLEDSVPAFLTVAFIPLTFSITQGILWGFVSHVGLYVLAGRRRELPFMLIIIAAVSAVLLVMLT